MNLLPKAIEEAIEALSDLPGIGRRSAERLVFELLRNPNELDQKISKSIGKLKSDTVECEICHHLGSVAEDGKALCGICRQHNRDTRSICIVESPMDVIAIERTHEFKGTYHVLHGVISPMNKVGPEDLTLDALFSRLEQDTNIEEIILALSGNTEADATAFYIMKQARPHFTGKISRLARGIPTGGVLDFLDMGTLSQAMSDRREL